MAAPQAGAQNIEPELAAVIQQIRDAQQQVRKLSSLRPDQMLWRPDPASWSVGECISHLTVSVERYLPNLDAALEKARAAGKTGKGPFRHGFISSYFVRSLEPPPARRFKAPKLFLPPAQIDAARVATDFLAVHEQLIERARRADGLDLARVKVQSPALAILWLSLGKGIELMAAHARRHLWQAEQTLKLLGR